jgi:hypothetical protein
VEAAVLGALPQHLLLLAEAVGIWVPPDLSGLPAVHQGGAMIWELQFAKEDVVDALESQLGQAEADFERYQQLAEVDESTIGSVTYMNAAYQCQSAASEFRFWREVLDQTEEDEISLTQEEMGKLALTVEDV